MQNKDTLSYLLARCTARLVVSTRNMTEIGTGFFVGPGYLLTCAHVVGTVSQRQGTIEVTWNRQTYTATIEQITDEHYPDLALLKVDGIPSHPCVYLYDDVQLKDDFYTYGYPSKQPGGDSIISRYIGPTGNPESLLTFDESNVRPGFSGSPLLNLRTGAVCGVVESTMKEYTPLGGRGVPIAHALEAFPTLQSMQQQFHGQDQQWANSLTPQQRQVNRLGKLVSQSEPVTLFFSYAPNKPDTKMLKELEKHLSLLRREKIIDTWYEGKTIPGPGEEPAEQVMQHIQSSQVILLLISPDYIADDTLYDIHIRTAMARHTSKEATVIPIYLRFIDNWEAMPFHELLVLPRSKKPIDDWDNKDKVFAEIAGEIRESVYSLRKGSK